MGDLALLEQVELRLSLCESDEKFQVQLHKLLVPVLCQLSSADTAVKGKAIQILTYASSMLQKRPMMTVNIEPLLELLQDASVNEEVKTATRFFLQLGFLRLDPTRQAELVPAVVTAMRGRPVAEQTALLLLVVTLLRGLSTRGDPASRAGLFGLDDAALMGQFLAIVRNLMLLANADLQPAGRTDPPTPPASPGPASALVANLLPHFVPPPFFVPARTQAVVMAGTGAGLALAAQPVRHGTPAAVHVATAAATAAAAVAAAASDPAVPPAGLSRAALLSFVDGRGAVHCLPTREQIIAAKRSVLYFITASAIFPDAAVLPMLFAAAGDASADVSSDAETAIKHRVSANEIETPAFAALLFDLLLGTPPGPAVPLVDQRRSAGSPKLRLFIMPYLNRCVSATAQFPAALQTVFLCLNGDGTTPRLRVLGMQFVVRLFEHAPPALLAGMAKIIYSSALLRIINTAEAPADLLSITFVALGVLGRKLPELFRNNTELLTKFFDMACNPDSQISSAVQETLHLLAPAFANPDGPAHTTILALLEKYLQHSLVNVRIVALRYCDRVFPKTDTHARYLLLLGTCDARDDVVKESLAALYRSIENGVDVSSKGTTFYPAFPEMLAWVCTRLHNLPYVDLAHTFPLTAPLMIQVLRYLRCCLGCAAGVDEDETSHVALTGEVGGRTRGLRAYLDRVELAAHTASAFSPSRSLFALARRALVPEESALLHVEALKSLVELILARPAVLAADDSLSWLSPYCTQSSEHVRDLAGAALGACAAALTAPARTALALTVLRQLSAAKASAMEARDGLLGALGHILACTPVTHATAAVTATPTAPAASGSDAAAAMVELTPMSGVQDSSEESVAQMAVAAILQCLKDPSDIIVCAACKALGEVGRSRPLFPSFDFAAAATSIDKLVPTPAAAAATATATAASTPAATAAAVVPVAPASGLTVLPTTIDTPATVLAALAAITLRPVIDGKGEKVSTMSFKMQEAAISCIGLIGAGQYPHPDGVRMIAALTATAEKSPQPELHFTVGRALALIATGPLSSAIYDELHPLPPTTTTTTASATSLPGTSSPLLASLLDEIFSTWLQKTLARARQAAGMWLVTLVRHCGQWEELRVRLPMLQNAFADLLSEGDDFTQDIASKGLGMIYELGDAAMKSKLVSSLVSTLVEGRRATTQKFTTDSEDAVFAAGQLGRTKEGANISTYKELCSLATELNQPDLIYKFMHLANHNAMWNSRKGAAFGFAQIAAQAQEQLKPVLPAMIPKLYRYQFDPNRGVHDSMTQIWKLLVPDSSKAVDAHFQAILKEVMTNITNSAWRARESCALALADLLRGRRWEEVGQVLPELWRLAFRALDDVKESVRVAGQGACARMRTLSVELCHGERSTAKDAVGAVLDCLTTDGLLSPVSEIRFMALGVMVDVAKHANAALKPYTVPFMMTLLEALSALESPSLSYLSQRISGVDSTGAVQDVLDGARLQQSKSGPIMECILRCVKQVDESNLAELVPRLTEMMKKGIGPGTKAGCAHVASMLAMHLTRTLGPYSGKLLKALMSGTLIKSAPIRRDYVTAIADVARTAPHDALDQLLEKLRTMSLAHDKNDHIEASAVVSRALSQRAPDVFKSCADGILPLAFVGRYCSMESAKQAWRETWDENTGGDSAGIKLYAVEIAQAILGLLKEREWPLKKQGSEALIAFCPDCPVETLAAQKDLFHTDLLDGVKGRVWDGKAAMVGALVSVAVALKDSYIAVPARLAEVSQSILRECARKDLQYRLDTLPHLARFLLAFYAHVDFAAVYAVIRSSIEEEKQEDSSDEEHDAAVRVSKRSAGFGLREDVKAAALDALANAWPRTSPALSAAMALAWPLVLSAVSNSAAKARRAALLCLKQLLAAAIEASLSLPLLAQDRAAMLDVLVKTLQDKQSALRRISLEVLFRCRKLGLLAGPPADLESTATPMVTSTTTPAPPIAAAAAAAAATGVGEGVEGHGSGSTEDGRDEAVWRAVLVLRGAETDVGVRTEADKLLAGPPQSS